MDFDAHLASVIAALEARADALGLTPRAALRAGRLTRRPCRDRRRALRARPARARGGPPAGVGRPGPDADRARRPGHRALRAGREGLVRPGRRGGGRLRRRRSPSRRRSRAASSTATATLACCCRWPPGTPSRSALLVVLGLAGAPTVVLAACGAIAGATLPPVGAVVRPLLPELLDGRPELLPTAFALDSVLIELSFVVGPLLAAVSCRSSRPPRRSWPPACSCSSAPRRSSARPRSRAWVPSAPAERHPLGPLAAPGGADDRRRDAADRLLPRRHRGRAARLRHRPGPPPGGRRPARVLVAGQRARRPRLRRPRRTTAPLRAHVRAPRAPAAADDRPAARGVVGRRDAAPGRPGRGRHRPAVRGGQPARRRGRAARAWSPRPSPGP